MNEKEVEGITKFLVAASLTMGTIGGCTPRQTNKDPESFPPSVKAQELVQTPEIQEERITPTPTETPFNAPISTIEKEKEFDDSVINTETWSTYSLEAVEQKEEGYGVTTTNEAPMLLIPVKNDNLLDYDKQLKEIIIPTNSSFEIAQIRTLKGENGQEIKIGLVANTYGANATAAILLEAKDSNGTQVSFAREKSEKTNIVTYIATEDYIYPNKIANTLTALKNISEVQDKNGPFTQGNIYSYSDLVGLTNPSKLAEYEYGLTSTKAEVKAGGVCAMATGISSLIHLQEDEGYMIKEQWPHPARYNQGPFSQSEYKVDASVDDKYDFQWSQGKDGYLQAQTILIPSGIPFEETNYNGVGGPSDAILIVSLSFTDKQPRNQADSLSHTLEQYQEYRESHHQIPLNSYQKEINVVNSPIEGKIKDSVELIYNPQELLTFKNETDSSYIIENLFELQDAVNGYSDNLGIYFSQYLKQTQWYNNFVTEENKERVDKIITLSSTSNVEGQAIQCVGFVMLASWLYPDLNIPYVGSASVVSARGLVPQQLLDNKYIEVVETYTNYGANALAGPIPIEQYKPGDLFVVPGEVYSETAKKPFGHIGLIVAKHEDSEGNVTLLVADANRHSDGKINIFEVNENNMEEIFGAKQRYIIRKR